MRKLVLTLALAAFGMTGCTTDPYTGEQRLSRTAIGTGIGVAAGAGIGALTGIGNRKRATKNALIGAGIGTLAGAGVGLYMDSQASKLRQELQSTGVSVKRVGEDIQLVMPGNVTFKSGSSDIQAQFYPVLDSVSKVLVEYEKTYVDIVGHTDSTGSAATNQQLSQQRARSVLEYFRARGVQQVRMIANGMGPSQPVATNDTAAGREQNRRVEILLSPVK